jgi:hypothetical protein
LKRAVEAETIGGPGLNEFGRQVKPSNQFSLAFTPTTADQRSSFKCRRHQVHLPRLSSHDIFKTCAAAGPEISSGRGYALKETRIVFKTVIKPIIVVCEADQHAGRLAVLAIPCQRQSHRANSGHEWPGDFCDTINYCASTFEMRSKSVGHRARGNGQHMSLANCCQKNAVLEWRPRALTLHRFPKQSFSG